VLRGAVPVFVDIRPDIAEHRRVADRGRHHERTRAIVPVHYAGVGCEMDAIMAIANRTTCCDRRRGAGHAGHYKVAAWCDRTPECVVVHETRNIISGEAARCS